MKTHRLFFEQNSPLDAINISNEMSSIDSQLEFQDQISYCA